MKRCMRSAPNSLAQLSRRNTKQGHSSRLMDAGLGFPWKSGLDPQTFIYAFVGTEPGISSLNRGGGSWRGGNLGEEMNFPPLPRDQRPSW